MCNRGFVRMLKNLHWSSKCNQSALGQVHIYKVLSCNFSACLGGGHLFKEWMNAVVNVHCTIYAHIHIYTAQCTCAKIEHINAKVLLGGMHLCREGMLCSCTCTLHKDTASYQQDFLKTWTGSRNLSSWELSQMLGRGGLGGNNAAFVVMLWTGQAGS